VSVSSNFLFSVVADLAITTLNIKNNKYNYVIIMLLEVGNLKKKGDNFFA
jgi:hypothetical protein